MESCLSYGAVVCLSYAHISKTNQIVPQLQLVVKTNWGVRFGIRQQNFRRK